MLTWLRGVKTGIVQNTTQQSGPTAARYRWLAARAQIALVAALNIATWVTVRGVIVGESVVVQIGLVLCVAPIVLAARMLFLRHRYFTSASEELGLRVTWRHPVPIEDDRFKAWCGTHGVISYSQRNKNSSGPYE
jgi:hypothetical protein